MQKNFIEVIGAKQNNLKNININIPKNKLTVITGLSGSGKSSLAFDTIYAEGQRRYIESLSTYARQFLNVQNKPDVESITGLSPAIAIDQKVMGKNPRSTVGTVTEIYDYLRLLYARIGVPYSPKTGKPLQSQTPEDMVKCILSLPTGTKISILAPIVKSSRGEHRKELIKIRKQGYVKIKVDDEIFDITNALPKLDKAVKHNIDIVLDTITVNPDNIEQNILRRIKSGLENSDGVILVDLLELPNKEKTIIVRTKEYEKGDQIRFSRKYTCPETGLTIDSIEPKLFSFNNPFGACPKCDGLGTESYFNPELIIMDKNLSIRDGAIDPWKTDANAKIYIQMIEELGDIYDFNIDMPYYKYSEEVKNIILYGSDKELTVEQETGLNTYSAKMKFAGVVNILIEKFNRNKDEMLRDELSKYQSLMPCNECHGFRLNEEALSVKILGVNIGEICQYSIKK